VALVLEVNLMYEIVVWCLLPTECHETTMQ
jgi:hypothetical protein